MAELFLEAFVTALFEKLISGDMIRLAKSAGISSELKNLESNLTLIRAVLADAAQKQIRDTSVQVWLNQLQHLTYEIDDVLDDLQTEAMRSQLKSEASTSKVLKYIPTKFHALKYGYKMSSKLDEITDKLSKLVEQKKLLGLSNNNVERSNRASRRLEETSLVGDSIIVGREGDKEALLGMLLESSNSKNVNVVSIVGLGGIGKSTLAQLLYNDKRVKSHFEPISWVCVSDEFDVFTVSKAIYKDVGGGDEKFENLNQLQVALTEKLIKKRFLLVLDDVWDENNSKWELLKRPFTVGAHGSKVLVTTRNAKVALVMDSVQTHHLDILSNEEALSLFAQHASSQQNFDVNRVLKLHGEDIVKKCGRLPLALRTLGGVFRTKITYEEWEELLNSEMWKLDKESGILPALKLSYYDLKPHLKQMFVYCCLFPKDYTFGMDELVLLWMAEGFLYESNEKSMESLGRECFQELVSRSFFQQSNSDESKYTMHDLINDLARIVAGEFFFVLEDKMDVYDRNAALEKLHHISFIHEPYALYRKFKSLQRTRCLRTFLAMPITRLSRWDTCSLSYMVLVKLLPELQFLRVLSLANCSVQEVPESIGSFRHLRYLNFSNTWIKCLPEQVGDLLNLQSLLLSGCNDLHTLPNSIVKLINLRHLDITDTPELNEFPLGFGGLTGLQTLSKVIIGGFGKFIISDLKGYLHLHGQLSIEDLHKVKNTEHAKEANLQQKKGICDLQLKWSDVFDDSRNKLTEYEVLEGLRPFEKLRSLKILYYNGTKFPSWVGDPSFDCLTQITLTGCRNCECLPTLGHLQSLQKLCVESIHELDRVGSEFLGHSNSCVGNAFPALEVLEFKNMPNWKEWSTSDGEKHVTFPCLREISILGCPKLDIVAIASIPSLLVLHLSRCSVVVLKSIVSVCSSIARLEIRYIEGLTQLHGEILEHLGAVEYLKMSYCSELTYLWESEAAACEIMKSLQKLEISNCKELVSLAEKEAHLGISMESVTEVRIRSCKRLKSYMCPDRIEKLEISNCKEMVSLGEKEAHLGISMESLTEVRITSCQRLKSYMCPDRIEKLSISDCPLVTVNDVLPSSLKFLDISKCDNLEVRWSPINSLPSLESLYIDGMPNMRLFPGGCLSYLTRLTICGCDNIESIPDNGYGFLPSLSLKELTIYYCKNLKSFPYEQLQNLTSLEAMVISNCPCLDFPFPSGLWPPNLSRLNIGGLKKDISEWGMQNFPTSLVELHLHGENLDGVVSFAAKGEEDKSGSSSSSSFILPSSLTTLYLRNFKELESVSEGLQHLTCLQHLDIQDCPKVRDLPEKLLPSLSSLTVRNPSPQLKKKCSKRRRRKGKYWSIISQIPRLELDSDS